MTTNELTDDDAFRQIARGVVEAHRAEILANAGNLVDLASTIGRIAGQIAMRSKSIKVNAVDLVEAVGRGIWEVLEDAERPQEAPPAPAAPAPAPSSAPGTGTEPPLGPENANEPAPKAPQTPEELAKAGLHPDGTPFTAKERKKAGLPPLEAK